VKNLTFFDKMQLVRKGFEAGDALVDMPVYRGSNLADQKQLIIYENFINSDVPFDEAMMRLRARVNLEESLAHLSKVHKNRRVISSECQVRLEAIISETRKLKGSI